MNITAGSAIVHVRDLGEDQSLEIDTPNVAVTLQSPGDYRVQVNEAGILQSSRSATVMHRSVPLADGGAAHATGLCVRRHGSGDCGCNFCRRAGRIGFMVSGTGIVALSSAGTRRASTYHPM